MLVDFYEVLGVAPTASAAQVRAAYQAAALASHPDKCTKGGAAARFQWVQRAWEVLREERSRAEYDTARGTEVGHVSEEVRAEDMEACTCEGGAGGLRWACRCGGAFSLPVAALIPRLGDGSSHVAVVVICDGCSLRVRVLGPPPPA